MLRHSMKAALVAAAALAPFTDPVRAACDRWNVSGTWSVSQTNGFSGVQIRIDQSGGNITGLADWKQDVNSFLFGDIDGSVEDNSVEFTIYWHGLIGGNNADSIGVYKGTINRNGRIEGDTFDRMNPKSRAGWYTARPVAQCADAAAPAAEAPPPKKTPKTAEEKMQGAIKKGPKLILQAE